MTQPGELWVLGRRRVKCGDAKDALAYEDLMAGALAAMVIADPPYNVAINGHVSRVADEGGTPGTGNSAVASGELSDGEFLVLLRDWAEMMSRYSAPGSLTYAFMDWRHAETMIAAGLAVFDEMLNICVWAKSSAGMGSLYRSAHEFVFIFKKAGKSHRNNVQLGRFGRDRTNVWTYPGAAVMRRAEDAEFTRYHPHAQAGRPDRRCDPRRQRARGHRPGSVRGVGLHADRGGTRGARSPDDGARSAIRRSDHPAVAAAHRRRRRARGDGRSVQLSRKEAEAA